MWLSDRARESSDISHSAVMSGQHHVVRRHLLWDPHPSILLCDLGKPSSFSGPLKDMINGRHIIVLGVVMGGLLCRDWWKRHWREKARRDLFHLER